MKTNQMMEVAFFGDKVHIEHKTAMGSLTDVFHVGNRLRYDEGKKPSSLTQFLEREATKEYIKAAEQVWGIAEGKAVEVRGRGNTKGTFAHLSVLIYAAEYLSPLFHAMVIKEFINNKLLEFRDEPGDNFKMLNIAIDQYLPGREGKDNKGVYIQTAVAVKEKINPDGGTWNTANACQLRQRAKLEEKLFDALRMGFIRDWPHFKEAIAKL